jgi:hypothetical protein
MIRIISESRVFLRLGGGQRPEKVGMFKCFKMRNLELNEMVEVNGGIIVLPIRKLIKDAIEGIVTIFC